MGFSQHIEWILFKHDFEFNQIPKVDFPDSAFYAVNSENAYIL